MTQQNSMNDILKVFGITISGTAMTFTDFNTYLTTCSILIAMSYTLWKWSKDYKQKRNENK